MDNFVFYNPTKIYFGTDQLCHLGSELNCYGKKVLLVYGGNSIKASGLYDKIICELNNADMVVYELPGVEPNPRHTTVNKGAVICKENNVDVILAAGGGSVIDCAKAIAVTAKYEGDDCWDLISRKAVVNDNLPIVSILTLSATGSEMDLGAVISNTTLNKKWTISSPNLRCNVSFLDPTATYTVGTYQTACGCVDIMSHIMDRAYFSTKDEMDMLLRLQEEVLKTVVKYGPAAIKAPNNYDARANLMWASTLAMNGFVFDGLYQDAICHRIEHELSAYYDITHGHGLAIVIPRWLRYILSNQTAPRIKRFGEVVLGVDSSLSLLDGAEAAINKLEEFFYITLGLNSKLSALGITDEYFAQMAKNACGRIGTMTGFTVLDPNDVEKIYRMCM